MKAPKARILIVDDEPDTVELISFNLRSAGYEAFAAADGGEALRKARDARPDLIILDLMMPELDGLEVNKLLRADPRTAAIPVIVFSMLAAAQRASEAGANAFLRKPLVESLFMAAVQNAILPQLATRETQWASK